MIWVVVVALGIGIVYFMSKKNEKGASTSSSGNNQEVPTRLKGIHPNANSFWSTEEFYSRLGEECAKITDNKFVLSLNVKPNGDFSAHCSFTDSAETFFPVLSNDLQSSFYGHDEEIPKFGYTAQRFSEIIQDDAPSAQITHSDDLSGKTFSIVWNPNGLP